MNEPGRTLKPVKTEPNLAQAGEAGPDPGWARLRQDLAGAIARRCPSWLRSRAEDMVQAAMIKVMELGRKGEGERELSSFYLYRVAHSALVDEIRRQKRRQEVALESGSEDDPVPAELVAAGADPERSSSSRELGLAIASCLGAMQRDRRLAVTLYLQGHSVPETAQLLDWPAKRTENLVYRGLADLRQCLLGKGHRP
ncbi:MAG: RNA polymerase sigma factor [Thermoanaerobaculia bacterium]